MAEKCDVQLVCTFFNRDEELKMKVTIAVLGGVLLSASMTPQVFAATQTPEKMTCKEFVALDEMVKPKVVYWAEGLNRKGKPIDSVVDVDETDKLVPVLVAECKETPEHSLMKKIKEHLAPKSAATQKAAAPSVVTAASGVPQKPATAATPKPVKMSCKEFVALDDTVKPKVVYWAEGFSKKGKPVDSVIDVDETDKLVPMLVTECKETPKLSFWQKIKKHF